MEMFNKLIVLIVSQVLCLLSIGDFCAIAGVFKTQSGVMSIGQAWQYALKNSTASLEARLERRIAGRRRADARTGLLPTLEFNVGPNFNNFEDEGNYWVANLRLTNPNKNVNEQIFKLVNQDRFVRIGDIASEAMLEDLRFELIKGYCQHYYDGLKLERLEEVKAIADKMALNMAENQNASVDDLKVRIEMRHTMISDRTRIEQTRIERSSLLVYLKKIMGMPANENFYPGGDLTGLIGELAARSFTPPDTGTNIDLQLLQEKLELLTSRAKFENLRKYPEPYIGIDFGIGPILRTRSSSSSDVDDFRYQVFLGLKWTLWDWGRVRRNIEEVMDSKELHERRIENRIKDLENEWFLIQAKGRLYERRCDELRNLSRQAEEYVELAYREYLAGRESFRIYYEMWRQLIDLKLEILDLERSILFLGLETLHLFGGLEKFTIDDN